MSARIRVWVRYFWALVLASDADLGRLRLALRAVLTVGLTAGLLQGIAEVLHIHGSVMLLGASIGMTASTVVTDERRAAQAWTLAWVPVPVGLTLLIGTLLSSSDLWGPVGFVGLTFVVVLVRVEGPRAVALGLIAFMAYFFALYFRAPLSMLGWMMGAVVTSVAMSAFVRFVLVPETPRRVLSARERALRARVESVLLLLAVALRHGEKRWKPVRRGMARLNELTLDLENQLRAAPREVRPKSLQDATAAARIYELELAVEWLGGAVRTILTAQALPLETREKLAHALEAFPNRGMVFSFLELARRDAAASSAPADLHVHGVASSLQTVMDAFRTGGSPGRAFPDVPAMPLPPMAAVPLREALKVELRRALQASLAVGVAISVGKWISPERWPWAVLAAYLVFHRATTLGDSVQRAWQRVFGTVMGAIFGIALAHLVAGHPHVELVTLFVCVFLGYYLLRLSYTWMMLFVTAELAILYSLLGRYSTHVLGLRVLETLVGAVAGSLSARLIFPTHTRSRAREILSELLVDVSQYLERLAAPREAGFRVAEARAQGRDLDRKLVSLREATKPFDSLAWFGAPEITRRVLATGRLIFYTRGLARMLHPGGGELPSWADETLSLRIRRASVRTRGLEKRLRGEPTPEDPPFVNPETLPKLEGSTVSPPAAWEPWVAHQMVTRLNEALAELSTELGVKNAVLTEGVAPAPAGS